MKAIRAGLPGSVNASARREAHKLPLHDDHWGWDELVLGTSALSMCYSTVLDVLVYVILHMWQRKRERERERASERDAHTGNLRFRIPLKADSPVLGKPWACSRPWRYPEHP